MKCLYCDNEVSPERLETGRAYCMDPYCLAHAAKKWAEGWRLVLVPKQGFAWVKAEDVSLQSGRSSGR